MGTDFGERLDSFFYRADEDVTGVLELGEEHVAPPPAREEERPMDFLGFELGSEAYAIPVEAVREVLRVAPLTEVPRGAENLIGVFTRRGEVIPVYDLKRKLHLADATPQLAGPFADLSPLPRSSRVLVLHGEEGPAGVLVDGMKGVVRLVPSAVEPPPRGLPGAEADGVVGLGRKGEALYILLDVEKALA